MMTIDEIFEQARAPDLHERMELTKRLIDTFGEQYAVSELGDSEEHWGRSLNYLLDEVGPIELKYPEIDDPVEWVKHLRAESRRRRLGHLDALEDEEDAS